MTFLKRKYCRSITQTYTHILLIVLKKKKLSLSHAKAARKPYPPRSSSSLWHLVLLTGAEYGPFFALLLLFLFFSESGRGDAGQIWSIIGSQSHARFGGSWHSRTASVSSARLYSLYAAVHFSRHLLASSIRLWLFGCANVARR